MKLFLTEEEKKARQEKKEKNRLIRNIIHNPSDFRLIAEIDTKDRLVIQIVRK